MFSLFLPCCDPATMSCYCHAHGIVNVAKDLFQCVCNCGKKKFTPEMQHMEGDRVGCDGENDDVLPWAVDGKDVKAIEQFISKTLAGSKERECGATKRGPFFTDASRKPSAQRDRKMVFWTLSLKCPLAKPFLHMSLHQSAHERAITPMFKLCDTIALSLTQTTTDADLDELETKMNSALDDIEAVLPKQMSTMCMHLLRHTADQMRRTGPLHQSWTHFMERHVRFVRGRVSVQNRTLTSIKNAFESWLRSNPLSEFRAPVRPAHRDANDQVRMRERRTWNRHHPTNHQAVRFFEAVELCGLDQNDGMFHHGQSCVVNDGPMFRIDSVETHSASKNSWVICLFEEKGNPIQVLGHLHQMWKWHSTEEPDRCHYAFFVKCKTTTLLTMHRPSGFHLHSSNIQSARGSAKGEFVSTSNIAIVNPILAPHINTIGEVKSVSQQHYHVIDPADAVAQWDD